MHPTPARIASAGGADVDDKQIDYAGQTVSVQSNAALANGKVRLAFMSGDRLCQLSLTGATGYQAAEKLRLFGYFMAIHWRVAMQEATMRGDFYDPLPLFHVFEVEDRIRSDHPLRDIKRRADRILESLNAKCEAAYSATGRPSAPPERPLKALLWMALYSVRSERPLCEQIDHNLLFRWFLDLQPSEDAFDSAPSTRTANAWKRTA